MGGGGGCDGPDGGTALGGTAVTVGGALLFDELWDGPHIATHNAMKTITVPIAIWVHRVFERAGTASSPSHVSPWWAITPGERGFPPAPVGGYGDLKQREPGSATLAGLLGLAAFAVDGLS